MGEYKDYVLTGEQRYRTDRKGRVILQVKEVKTFSADYDMHGMLSPYDGKKESYWRDAKLEDITVETLKG